MSTEHKVIETLNKYKQIKDRIHNNIMLEVSYLFGAIFGLILGRISTINVFIIALSWIIVVGLYSIISNFYLYKKLSKNINMSSEVKVIYFGDKEIVDAEFKEIKK
jgi:ABC-type bacteriocin/lantibiotic exporter with double-glycine peptidase domain